MMMVSIALSQNTPGPGSVITTPPGGAEGRGLGRRERTEGEARTQCTSTRSKRM